MTARWVALAMMLVTIAVVGVFIGAVLWPPAPVTSNGNGRIEDLASEARQLTGRAGAWSVTAEIDRGPAGVADIVVSVADAEGRPATPPAQPIAVLRMLDMAMGTQPVSLLQEAPGRWRGSGRLAMDGRWSLEVDIGGAGVSLPFETSSP